MYQEFDVASALAPVSARKTVKLEGVSNVARVFNSSSTSTEEFISAAVADAGAVDRSVMFVNTMLNGLNDRLQIANNVAKRVNYAKAHSNIAGCEAFANVEYLDPWKYAIEGKATEFFKRIWAAIRTACRRIINMIANFIKWLGNAIASLDVKSQVKDQKTYVANKALYDKAAKAAGVGNKTIPSLKWKVDQGALGEKIKKAAKHYVDVVGKDQENGVFRGITSTDLKTLTTPEALSKAFVKIFAIKLTNVSTWGSSKNAETVYNRAAAHVEAMIKQMDTEREEGIKRIFTISGSEKVSAHNLVIGALSETKDAVQVSINDIHKKAGANFEVLQDSWLANNVKASLSATNEAQKQFTAYTKTIDRVAAQFDKVTKDVNGISSLSNLTSKLANARIRYSGFYTGLMLELQAAALRFRKTAHIALKQIIKAAKEPAKASKESLARDIDDIFAF